MQKAKVTVYGHRVISKPAMRHEYGIIKNGKWEDKELSIQEIVDSHCIDKYPIAPATFNGKICNDNWCSTQLIMLDFDGGITIEEVKSKFSEFNIDITFTTSDPDNSGSYVTAKYNEIIRPDNIVVTIMFE